MHEPTVGKRFYPRFPHDLPIAIRKVSSTRVVGAELIDLSIGGCLFRTAEAASLNLADFVEVKLRSTCVALRLVAWVRHLDHRNGLYGVEFHRLGEKETSYLYQTVDELVPQLAARQLPQPRFEPVRSSTRLPELVMAGGHRSNGS